MPSRPGWVSVCVDRRRVGAITVEAAARLGVVVGNAGNPAPAAGFPAESAYLQALHDATALLRRAPRTEADLTERLGMKGNPPAAIRRAIEELRARGLPDDARLAGERAGRDSRRGLAPPLIEAKLLADGHNPETAGRAAREAARGVDPLAEAQRLLRRRVAMRPVRAGEERRARARLFALLQRNGYDAETSSEAVRRVLGEQAGEV